MSILLPIIAVVLGTVFAFANDITGWFGAGLGAAFGLLAARLLSQSRRSRALSRQLAEAESKVEALRAHVGHVLPDIHQRLVRIEDALVRGVVSPASVAPDSSVTSVAEVAMVAEAAIAAAEVTARAAAAPVATDEPSATPEAATPEAATPEAATPEAATPEAATPEAATPEAATPEAAASPTHPMRVPVEPRDPSLLERGFYAARGWLLGGNTIVRVGVVLLFLGLAFLLRYATERVVVPIEFRYAGVAAAALALLFVGWRTRLQNAAYGLLLQGAAVAVLYLTTFAAMRLHPLLPMQAGFVLLVVVAALAAFLAIRQDAPGLAIAGTLGGFAAPVLASNGGGSHVALFSYLLLLNAGVLTIAWFKSWRVLNLVGFVGTFGIGLTWGLRSYQPEHFASCEGFLLAFFLMYVLLALLFARHQLASWAKNLPKLERSALLRDAASHANAIDGTLIFGVPLAAFGIQLALVHDFEFGSAFSALGLGAFYLVLARVLFERGRQRFLLLVEVFLALGVVFTSLSIPLAQGGQWTTAAWALEGAGIFWVGSRQQRPLARAFALLLQVGAALYFLRDLRGLPADAPALLGGSWLGAALLALAFLSNYWVAHAALAMGVSARDSKLKPVFAVLGLIFAYLIAPLLGGSSFTAVAWAIWGLSTVWCGLRLGDQAYWVACGMLVQLAAGALYLINHSRGAGDSQVFAAGLSGLLICALVGVTTLVSAVLAQQKATLLPRLAVGMRLMLLFGLGLINLSVLFVLPWRHAAAVWAGSGLLIVWLSLWLGQRLSLWFGLALQLAGAAALVGHLAPVVGTGELDAFRHAGFTVPLVLALAAYGVAWRIHRNGVEALGTLRRPLSLIALLWASPWWAYAWAAEFERVLVPRAAALHAMLIALSLTAILWALAARRFLWADLSRCCFALLPAAAILLFMAMLGHRYTPWAHAGALAWVLGLAAHLLVLRLLTTEPNALWARARARSVHAGGVWLFLLVLALGLRRAFAGLGDEASAWAWLGWALAPTGYLLIISRVRHTRLWPVRDDLAAYRDLACGPVVLALLAWVVLSNLASTGSPRPLPYVPLLNPLELAFGFALLSSAVWQRQWVALSPNNSARWLSALLLAVTFLSYTCGVARAVHHWAGVPFMLERMLHSMIFQASLSIAWSVAALAMMVLGHRRAQRTAWIIGAALVAVVVAKLFLVELSNRGGLERIVSFIGVGVLLLVVGYFAPMPPRKAEQEQT